MSDPNLSTAYDPTSNKWYYTRFNPNTGQWATVGWVDDDREYLRSDSHLSYHQPDVQSNAWTVFRPNVTSNPQSSTFTHPLHGDSVSNPPRKGRKIKGTYDITNPNRPPNSHFEGLDPAFFVRNSSYFVEGRFFSILFTEADGTEDINKYTDYNTSISDNELVRAQVRRFIVIKNKRECCIAVPVFTYSGYGTKKPGVIAQEHSIAFSHGNTAQLLEEEEQLSKTPICIVTVDPQRPLESASRIYFGVQHEIQHNVKVKDLGYVHPDYLEIFHAHWTMEQTGEIRRPEEMEEYQHHPAPRIQVDPNLYHPVNNVNGYDPDLAPHMYHPTLNIHGYHPQRAPDYYHPSHNPYGYHPQRNRQGYHPQYNRSGYHPQHNP